MGVFGFEAIDPRLKAIRGTLTADSPREARDQLRARGLSVVALRDRGHGFGPLGFWAANWSMSFRPPDTTLFLRELATLLEVGTPLLDALDTMIQQARGRHRPVWLSLREQVASGKPLAIAFRDLRWGRRPVFSTVAVAMVEVGEDAGRLDEVLEETAAFQERSGEFRNRLVSALMYPAAVAVVGLGVCIFLMTHVVPGLLESLADANRELPRLTLAVKALSDLMTEHGAALALVLVVLTVAATLGIRTERGGRIWSQIWRRVPWLGELSQKQSIARLAFVLATLLRSGVPFERAIGIARGVVRSSTLRNALQQCETAVSAGREIGPAFAATHAFPPTVVQVFALGQASGNLDRLLDRLARAYDRQVATLASRFTALVEPVIVVLLAILIGVVALATILPILEIGNAMD